MKPRLKFKFPKIKPGTIRLLLTRFSGELRPHRGRLALSGAALLATSLGTVAAVGLSNSRLPYKTLLMGILISPMIVPLVGLIRLTFGGRLNTLGMPGLRPAANQLVGSFP